MWRNFAKFRHTISLWRALLCVAFRIFQIKLFYRPKFMQFLLVRVLFHKNENLLGCVHTVTYISIKLYFYIPLFLYFWVGGIFPLKKYFQRNSMEYFWATGYYKIHLVFRAARQLIRIFDQKPRVWCKKLNCLAANGIRIICRTLCCENIPWNIPKYLNFNPHTKIKIFLQKYRNIEI